MRISHRHKFIYFSNPKTGSESVRTLLDPFSDIAGVPMWEMTADTPFYTHISPREVRDLFHELGWTYHDYYSFTFVRNPWARLVSLYMMIHAHRRGRLSRMLGEIRARAKGKPMHPSVRGFQCWLQAIRPDGAGGGGPPGQRWQTYGTYSIRAYAYDEDGKALVRRVIRLEDIDAELPDVLREIGLPCDSRIEVPRVNVRAHRSYVEFYDDSSRELVATKYSYDIAQFRYQFGE